MTSLKVNDTSSESPSSDTTNNGEQFNFKSSRYKSMNEQYSM